MSAGSQDLIHPAQATAKQTLLRMGQVHKRGKYILTDFSEGPADCSIGCWSDGIVQTTWRSSSISVSSQMVGRDRSPTCGLWLFAQS